jgi:hypothetical protein
VPGAPGEDGRPWKAAKHTQDIHQDVQECNHRSLNGALSSTGEAPMVQRKRSAPENGGATPPSRTKRCASPGGRLGHEAMETLEHAVLQAGEFWR